MAERYLSISNYRNVGIAEEQKILLNTSMKKGELGDLVIVVGPNNSGKSNCLDALLCLNKENKLSKNDIPDFFNSPKYPVIELFVKDEKVSVGTSKKLNDKGEIIESYYDEKGQERKTKVTENIEVSDAAKIFAFDLISNIPLKVETDTVLTQENKDFGNLVINTIANNFGTNYPQSYDANAYQLQRSNNEQFWNNRINIFSKSFAFLKQTWGVNWIKNFPNPYSTWDSKKVEDNIAALTTMKTTQEVPLSNKSLELMKLLSKKYSDISNKPISDRSKMVAITIMNAAFREDEKYSRRTRVNPLSSENFIRTYHSNIKLNSLPEEGVITLLDEAHNNMIRMVGTRYYNSLGITKAELDVCMREFRQRDSKNSDLDVTNIDIDYKSYSKEILDIYDNAIKLWKNGHFIKQLGMPEKEEVMEEYIYQLTTKSIVTESPEISEWEKKNNLTVNPNIVKFSETIINQKSLSEHPQSLIKNDFFNVLFKAIGFNTIELNNLYDDIRNGNKVTGSLRVTEKELNKKLEVISNQFNRLFFQSSEKYIFEIILETEKIEFSIYVGKLPLNLDRQSTGFRWFFNFYFTVVAQKGLKRGDIIVMDEPATNLHVSGIQELRNFIKEYANRNELTFVVSTHSPFMIDVDHLEEIRVVNRNNGEAIINNKFQVVQDDDTDALRPVKDALTVGRHVLIDPTKKTIFVEGITDYCYLTAFKKICPEAKGLYFLPIQGLKKENIIERILKIDKNPTIIVDSDHYGNGTKKMAEDPRYKGKVEVIKLDEIDKSFVDIESLFTESERPAKKSFIYAVSFKNRLDMDKIDKKTHQNFRKIFENISL